ncbi:hypothetical protein [Reinekea blandensis]|uniref:hypothetical protein n=1 Tax=Reinekea blandensis TaxID=374838 RepID=UPI000323AFAC|nr:hypothetical protein [Reinekea blandensis]
MLSILLLTITGSRREKARATAASVNGLMKNLALVVFIVFLSSCIESKATQAKAEALVIAIEQFREKNGVIPTVSEIPKLYTELGLEYSESCPCYQYIDENEYKVYWGTSLGESDYFDSKTNKWRSNH